MDDPETVKRAHAVTFAECVCCGSVTIQLCDADGAVFAVGRLSLDQATALTTDLIGVVHAGLARREMVCAGNA